MLASVPGLRQTDAERAKGILRYRLARAEGGHVPLNPAESRALESYYWDRWRMLLEGEDGHRRVQARIHILTAEEDDETTHSP
jgi:hypothetical protein